MVRGRARQTLATVERQAAAAGVPCASLWTLAPRPWQAITRTTAARDCDLIVMATHGREGLQALAAGSHTAKVLAHSRTPVLVCR
jgi:nucleotide-binding universal stress UspA family protein